MFESEGGGSNFERASIGTDLLGGRGLPSVCQLVAVKPRVEERDIVKHRASRLGEDRLLAVLVAQGLTRLLDGSRTVALWHDTEGRPAPDDISKVRDRADVVAGEICRTMSALSASRGSGRETEDTGDSLSRSRAKRASIADALLGVRSKWKCMLPLPLPGGVSRKLNSEYLGLPAPPRIFSTIG